MNALSRKLRALRRVWPFETERVLDVACGWGTYLAHFGPGSYGLDRVPGPARARGLEVLERDLDRTGWSRELPPFESVWLCDALVHLREPAEFLAELRASIDAGTRVVVVEWVAPERGWIRGRLADAVPGARAHWRHPEHLHRFTARGLEQLLGAQGLAVERCWLHSLPGLLREPPLARAFLPWLPPRTWLARGR
ncbi:MAG: methyltransferase domain-containing protein [Planctomycetota bacterium]